MLLGGSLGLCRQVRVCTRYVKLIEMLSSFEITKHVHEAIYLLSLPRCSARSSDHAFVSRVTPATSGRGHVVESTISRHASEFTAFFAAETVYYAVASLHQCLRSLKG